MILIRTDSSYEIGFGHLYRMLEVAKYLAKAGCDIVFLCRKLDGNLNSKITDSGFGLLELPSNSVPADDATTSHSHWLTVTQDDDARQTLELASPLIDAKKHVAWLIQDHFALSDLWQEKVASSLGCKIAVIDGLADRKHHCDLLIDPNWVHEALDWAPWLEDSCQLFLGPENILFKESLKKIKARRRTGPSNSLFALLVSFGGVDKINATMQTLSALKNLVVCRKVKIDVVIGAGYQYEDELRKYASQFSSITIHKDTDAIAELINKADLAVGAAGTMAWERLAQGLPTLHYCLADNQAALAKSLKKRGVASDMGHISHFSEPALERQVVEMMTDPDRLKSMSDECLSYRLLERKAPIWLSLIMDNKGTAHD